ncbi:MAG: D-2-hydroxyacid dehydrogenase [Natronomonas sp.]
MELLVLRDDIHAQSSERLAALLREQLPEHTVNRAGTPAAERELIETADVAVGLRIDDRLLEAAEELEVFACAYAGYGHLPLAALDAAGVRVTTAAGVHTIPAAEHAVGMALTLSRKIDESIRAEEWNHQIPRELAGSTATIVGLGAIGASIAERLDAFGVHTIGIRRRPAKGGPTDEVLGPGELHDALGRSSLVILCCPLTEDTRGLVSTEEFVTMPPEAHLVNVARGQVVDTDALLSALQRDVIEAAALDVTDPEPLPQEHPLWDRSDAIVTPHVAGSTAKYYDRLAEIVTENVGRLEAGQRLRNEVEIEGDIDGDSPRGE